MKKYIITIILVLVLFGLYRLYPIRLYSIDLPQQISSKLFNSFRVTPEHDTTIMILNCGTIQAKEFIKNVDELITHNPSVIGINLCDLSFAYDSILIHYKENPKIVMMDCNKNAAIKSSLIVEEDNSVTHFKTDAPDYFEIALTNAWASIQARGHKQERINYVGSSTIFGYANLYEIEHIRMDHLHNKIILIGYVEPELFLYPDLIHNFKNTYITPMNEVYGEYDETGIAPDMYGIQISANIISTINNGTFITEIPLFVRVVFIITLALLLTFLVSIIRTKWIVLNLVIYFILYTLFIIGATLLIVIAFEHRYYLEIPELSTVLLIVMLATIVNNLNRSRIKNQTHDTSN